MSERKTACNTYKVEYVCEMCNTGTMDATGSVVDTYPPKYQHICTSCGHEGYLETHYPEIRYEPVKALQIDWDAFEKHMNTQAEMQFYKVDEQGKPVRSDIHIGEEEK